LDGFFDGLLQRGELKFRKQGTQLGIAGRLLELAVSLSSVKLKAALVATALGQKMRHISNGNFVLFINYKSDNCKTRTKK